MTPENFVYWLQGYFEILSASETPATLNEKQIQMIKDHLGYVFNRQQAPAPIKLPDLVLPVLRPENPQTIPPGLPGGAGQPQQWPGLGGTPRPPWQPPYTVECKSSDPALSLSGLAMGTGKVEFC